jgi:glycosyltransferase involved in cell wall biosynthesis
MTNTPVIGVFHGTVDVAKRERHQFAKFAILQKGLDVCVFVSNHLKDRFRSEGLDFHSRERVIYNGVDFSRIDAFAQPSKGIWRDRLRLPEDSLVAACVGNVRPAKGYDVLLQASVEIFRRYPKLFFVVAGHVKQDLMIELKQIMDSLGIADRFRFVGFLDRPIELLADADLFVLSSTSEGFSLSTVEALSLKLPAVLTRCGGPEEIAVDGEHAIFANAGDPESLAESVIRLLSDRSLAHRLGLNASRMVRERFSLENMIEHYVDCYRNLL